MSDLYMFMEKKFLGIMGAFILSLAVFVLIIILGTIDLFGFSQLLIGPFGGLIPKEYVIFFIYILPGPIQTDVILIYALPILFFAVFYVVAPYVFLFWLRVHKLYKRSAKYGLYKMGSKLTATHLYYRAFIISLFSFSISGLIVEANFGYLFRAVMIPMASMEMIILHKAEAIFLGTFILTSLAILLFFPIWILEDSGVVEYRLLEDERRPPEIEGIHALFFNMMQGYAGFTAVLTLIIQVGQTLLVAEGWSLLTPIILIFLPFIATGISTPPILLYEKYLPNILERLKPLLDKRGIEEIEIPTFEETKIAAGT